MPDQDINFLMFIIEIGAAVLFEYIDWNDVVIVVFSAHNENLMFIIFNNYI